SAPARIVPLCTRFLFCDFVLVLQIAFEHAGNYTQLVKRRLVFVKLLEQIIRDNSIVLEMISDCVVLTDRDASAALQTSRHAGALGEPGCLAQVHRLTIVSTHCHLSPVLVDGRAASGASEAGPCAAAISRWSREALRIR